MHHALLFLGVQEETDALIQKFFLDLGVKVLGNPDVSVLVLDVFSVEDARTLGERSLGKAFGGKKFFVIKAQKFTPEAQNALLKIFEDPTPNTHFLLTARESNIFLPTILSRVRIERAEGGSEVSNEAEKFLKKGLKQRIDFAKKFADEKEERGSGALSEFLDSLIITLRSKEVSANILKQVLDLRVYSRDSSAMPRLILEHLALVV